MFQVVSITSITTTQKTKRSLNVTNSSCPGDDPACHLGDASKDDENDNHNKNDQGYML